MDDAGNRGNVTPTPDIGGAQTPDAGIVRVEVGDDFPNPGELTVESGTTVVFEWTGTHEHRLVSTASGGFETPALAGGRYEFTFDEPGNFDIHCTVHGPIMRGKITVVTD